jgi:serine/threonine protein kinase
LLTAGGGFMLLFLGIAAAWVGIPTTAQQLRATASYAPPERIRGGRPSPTGDLYSLGVVLYEMLTGRPPFLADNAEQLLRAHLEAAPRPVRSLVFWVPPEIAAVCEAAMSKDPAGRPSSAGELAAQLRAAAEAAEADADAFWPRTIGIGRPPEPTRRLSADQTHVVGQPRRTRRRSRAMAAAAGVLVVLGAAWAYSAFWQTTKVDRAGRLSPPSATIVRQTPSTRPTSITVTLRYRERAWTRCTVDGRLVFDGVGTPGERRSWTARRSLDLMLGNPTGVELVMDGEVLGRPHGHGRLWQGSFRPNRPPPPLG